VTARRVIVSAYASDDEARILTYVLGLRGVTAAKALLERFERGRRTLRRFAERGRVVPELRRRGVTAFRELQLPPYRLVYRIVGAEVWVVALLDGRRDLGDVLLERARG
jgi:plasmid stabilization system protein ParE